MLKLILGRNNTDSEKYIADIIKETAAKGSNVLYLVPEQYTVFAERTVIESCEPQLLKYIEVTNFSRLSNIVLRNTGVHIKKPLSEGGRYILMAKAFEAVFEKLSLYNRPFSGDFIVRLCRLYDEFGFYRIDIKNLKRELGTISDTLTGKKLLDLTSVMECYEANRGEMTDKTSELTFLEEVLKEYDGFSDFTFVFSNFDFLTPRELKITELLMKKSKVMYFSLCTDTLTDEESGYGLFSGVKELAVNLKYAALNNRIPFIEPFLLTENKKGLSPEIAFLEKNLFVVGSDQYKEKTEDISIYSAKDMYDEVEFIACKVSCLVREKGYRYRDFAIIGRNIQEYKGIIDTVFHKYNIPLFEDARSELLSKPLVILILSAVNIAIYGFETKNVFPILKSGLLDISEDDICLLQGYTYIWNINYGKWTEEKDWYCNPDGYSPDLSDRKKEELVRINKTRRELINPLLKFSKVCKKANDSLTMAKALYELLLSYNVPEMLKKQAKSFKESAELSLSSEQEQLWNYFVTLLDELCEVSKNETLDLKQFKEYLVLSFSGATIGKIPTSLDEISMGNADRIRVKNPKCVFAVGVNDGVFPKNVSDDSLINDKDKSVLEKLGLSFTDTTEDSAFEERFFCYKALTTATKKLFISYCKTGLDGREAMPSYLLAAVEALFPKIKKVDFSDISAEERIERKAPAFDKLPILNDDNKKLKTALNAYFENLPYYGELLERVRDIKNFGRNERLYDKDLLNALFGKELSFSPTRIEAFSDCAFKHFCKYGLKAEKKQKAELSSLQIGSFIHHALELAVLKAGMRAGGVGSLTDIEIIRLSAEISKKYLLENLGDEKNARFKYIYRRLSKSLALLISHLRDEFQDSLFVPSDFELKISRGSSVTPLEIPLGDNGKIFVSGVVDRVDIYEKDDIKFVRVVDYKTGSKNFKLNDIVNGLNLQMLIYLFSIWQNGKAHYKKDIIPAGILYYPAKRDILKTDRSKTADDIKAERQKKMRSNGLLLHDKSVLAAMEPSLSGKFLPIKETGKGFSGTSSLATLGELSHLKKYIESLLLKTGTDIKEGKIAINPIKDTSYDACRFCEMKEICGFEKGRNTERKYKTAQREELLGKEEDLQ